MVQRNKINQSISQSVVAGTSQGVQAAVTGLAKHYGGEIAKQIPVQHAEQKNRQARLSEQAITAQKEALAKAAAQYLQENKLNVPEGTIKASIEKHSVFKGNAADIEESLISLGTAAHEDNKNRNDVPQAIERGLSIVLRSTIKQLALQAVGNGGLGHTLDQSSQNVSHLTKNNDGSPNIPSCSLASRFGDVAQKTSEVKSAANWLQMAWKSFQGDRSPEIVAWQQQNRHAVPNLAAVSDGIHESQERKAVEGFGRGLKESAVATGQFLGEEAARLRLGEQTKIGSAVNTGGTFIGEEAARLTLGEQTKTVQFTQTVGTFIGEEVARYNLGEQTKTGTLVTKGLDALSRMPAEEITQHLGKVLGDTFISYGAARGAGLASSAVSRGTTTIAETIHAELTKPFVPFHSQLGFISRQGETLASLTENNFVLKGIIEDAQIGVGTPNAQAVTTGMRLRAQLLFQEAGFLDADYQLTAKALENKKFIIKGDELTNPAVIAKLTKDGKSMADWSKYSTPSIKFPNGESKQIHYYFNDKTGEVCYKIDFKIKDPVLPSDITKAEMKKANKEGKEYRDSLKEKEKNKP